MRQSLQGCVERWIYDSVAVAAAVRLRMRIDLPSGAMLMMAALTVAGCGSSGSAPTQQPAPAADYSMTVTPASQTVVPGTMGGALSVTATGTNGFSSSVAVATVFNASPNERCWFPKRLQNL